LGVLFEDMGSKMGYNSIETPSNIMSASVY
jgi:hypothetical protein